MSKELSSVSIKNYIDYIIFEFCRNNPRLINVDSLIIGIKNIYPDNINKTLIKYFKKLTETIPDINNITDNYSYIFQSTTGLPLKISYILGLLIGSRYIGVCGCDWTYCEVDILETYLSTFIDKEELFEFVEPCNCGNGRCLHILNIVPILKKIIKFDDNFSYGYYYGCEGEKSVYMSEINQDIYNKMLKHLEEFKKEISENGINNNRKDETDNDKKDETDYKIEKMEYIMIKKDETDNDSEDETDNDSEEFIKFK